MTYPHRLHRLWSRLEVREYRGRPLLASQEYSTIDGEQDWHDVVIFADTPDNRARLREFYEVTG